VHKYHAGIGIKVSRSANACVSEKIHHKTIELRAIVAIYGQIIGGFLRTERRDKNAELSITTELQIIKNWKSLDLKCHWVRDYKSKT
jgi:hypothetical protein